MNASYKRLNERERRRFDGFSGTGLSSSGFVVDDGRFRRLFLVSAHSKS